MARTIQHGHRNGYASLGAGGLSQQSFPMRLFTKGRANSGTRRTSTSPRTSRTSPR